jgi:outer membrane protein assembly factor BamE (lipoprotein component of BamABCDE complex)
MKSLLRFHLPVWLGAVILCAGLPGCSVVVDSSSNTQTSGKNVSPSAFAQIQPGETKDDVAALLGQPSKRIPLDAGAELWEWDYREVHTSSGGIIFLFHSERQTTNEKAAYVEFSGSGTVAKTWRD